MWTEDGLSVCVIYTKNNHTHISLFDELIRLHSLWGPLQG